ncbi:MAG: TauD/TfdA dioxygenase family protein [Rhodospirillaceae bacterium]
MFSVRHSDAVLGAEITGIDLSQPVSDDDFARIANVLHEREVIVFKRQDITAEQHIAFSRRFGDLERHVRTDKCRPGYPEIYNVSNVIENGKPIGSEDAGYFWHSDLCYVEKPSRGSLLYAKEVPVKDGVTYGNTLFSSMTTAYNALPEETKKKLEGRRAVNSFEYGYSRERMGKKRPPLTEEQREKTPPMEHPAVRTHPYTGKKCLFVNEAYTTKIVGMSDEESQTLLAELFAHIVRPEFIYTHKWEVGDLLFWDNCATQHRAIVDYALPLRRRMERTTIDGTVPF